LIDGWQFNNVTALCRYLSHTGSSVVTLQTSELVPTSSHCRREDRHRWWWVA